MTPSEVRHKGTKLESIHMCFNFWKVSLIASLDLVIMFSLLYTVLDGKSQTRDVNLLKNYLGIYNWKWDGKKKKKQWNIIALSLSKLFLQIVLNSMTNKQYFRTSAVLFSKNLSNILDCE